MSGDVSVDGATPPRTAVWPPRDRPLFLLNKALGTRQPYRAIGMKADEAGVTNRIESPSEMKANEKVVTVRTG